MVTRATMATNTAASNDSRFVSRGFRCDPGHMQHPSRRPRPRRRRESPDDPHDEAQQLTELFRLLGDPTRVQILYALVEVGELCVCDLAAVVDAPETSISHALRLLRTAGVVRNRKSGRMVYYSLNDAHVRLLLDVSAEHLRHEPNG